MSVNWNDILVLWVTRVVNTFLRGDTSTHTSTRDYVWLTAARNLELPELVITIIHQDKPLPALGIRHAAVTVPDLRYTVSLQGNKGQTS